MPEVERVRHEADPLEPPVGQEAPHRTGAVVAEHRRHQQEERDDAAQHVAARLGPEAHIHQSYPSAGGDEPRQARSSVHQAHECRLGVAVRQRHAGHGERHPERELIEIGRQCGERGRERDEAPHHVGVCVVPADGEREDRNQRRELSRHEPPHRRTRQPPHGERPDRERHVEHDLDAQRPGGPVAMDQRPVVVGLRESEVRERVRAHRGEGQPDRDDGERHPVGRHDPEGAADPVSGDRRHRRAREAGGHERPVQQEPRDEEEDVDPDVEVREVGPVARLGDGPFRECEVDADHAESRHAAERVEESEARALCVQTGPARRSSRSSGMWHAGETRRRRRTASARSDGRNSSSLGSSTHSLIGVST